MRCFWLPGLLLALQLQAQAAPLVSNGNFELGDGGFGAQGWAGGIRNAVGDGHNSTSMMILDAGFSTLSQTGSTIAGQLYQLTYYYRNFNQFSGAPEVFWNGNLQSANETFLDAGWTGVRLFVTGTGNDTLSFTRTNNVSFLDDVSLTAAPELHGAHFPLGLLTVSMLLLAERRRRTATV